MPRIVKLIYTEECRGTGSVQDKVRMVPQLWTLDGRLVVERDPQIHHGGEVDALRRADDDASHD